VKPASATLRAPAVVVVSVADAAKSWMENRRPRIKVDVTATIVGGKILRFTRRSLHVLRLV
jgi:hypothetical protein